MNDLLEKRTILISENHAQGNKMINYLSKKGQKVFQLEQETLVSFSKKILDVENAKKIKSISDISSNRIQLLSVEECALILGGIIKNNPNITFIKPGSYSSKTFEEIYRIMNFFRSEEKSDKWDCIEDTIVKEIKDLIEEYEKNLKEKNVYDDIRLLNEAKLVDHHLQYDGYIFANYFETLSALEKEVINKFFGGHLKLIEFENSENVICKIARGRTNEVQGILKEIKEQGLDINDVSIYYTNPIYENYLRAALGERKIPYLFLNSISALDNEMIQVMIYLLRWADGGFLYSDLKYACNSRLFNDENKEIGDSYEIVKGTGLGYGKEKYIYFLEHFNDEKYREVQKRYNRMNFSNISDKFVSFLQDLIEVFNQPREIKVGELLEKLLEFVKKYAVSFSMKDRLLQNTINKKIRLLKEYDQDLPNNPHLTLIEILQSLRLSDEMQEQIEIDEKKILSSYVQVERLSGVTLLNRKYNFIIGMDYSSYTPSTASSPVLPDELLEKYLCNIKNKLNRNSVEVKNKKFNTTFQTLMNGGVIYLICSYYDTLSSKDLSPSLLFAEKNKRSNDKIDYIYETGFEILSGNISNNKENLFDDVDKGFIDKLHLFFQLDEEEKEVKKIYTIGAKRKDGSLKTISPSTLQQIFNCPYQFIYSLSNIYVSEDQEKDLTCWLQPNIKGLFFHRVFELYGKKILDKEPVYDEVWFEEIFQETLEEIRMIAPIENDNTKYEIIQFRKEMCDWMKDVVKDLAENGWRIHATETRTELLDIDEFYDDEGNIYRIRYAGTIDRIDKKIIGNETIYRLVDYKTGRLDSIKKKINNHTEYQQVIYPFVMKKHGYDISEFIFEFPCEKGDNKKYSAEIKDLDELHAKIIFVINALKNKSYLVDFKEENDACKYCKFKEICFKKLKKDVEGDEEND